MAKRVVTQFIDDLDGKVLSAGESHTIHFGVNGDTYRIDLSSKNAERLHKTFDFYVEKSRKVSTEAKRQPALTKKQPTLSPRQASDIRYWAEQNGFTVRDRGRIPLKVMAAYEAAH